MTNAEMSVIGSMLIDADCIDSVAAILDADDFSTDSGKMVFDAIKSAWIENGKIDPIVISRKYENVENAEQLMIDSMAVTITSANAEEYARIVRDDSTKRMAVAVADRIALGYDLSACLLELSELEKRKSTKKVVGGIEWADKFAMTLERNMADPDSAFCKTGYQQLDDVLGGGLVKGGVYIIGARPGMGKTTFAINIAEKVAKRQKPVVFISLEMSPHQIMCKRTAIDSGIKYQRILTGNIDEDEKMNVFVSLNELSQRPFFVNTSFSMTVSDIGKIAKQCKGCELLVVDYFGLITTNENIVSRYEAYSEISRQLKELAGNLNIPILCLAQLNREVEKGNGRKNKKPNLSDLRDTGSLEQDADSVIFLHRDGYYDEGNVDEEINVVVKKNRHGDCGEVQMKWFGQYGQICAIDKTRNEEVPF